MIEEQERQLIHSVMEFGDTIVREVMKPRPEMVAVSIEDSPRRVLDVVTAEGYSKLPVYQESKDDIVGVIHDRELLVALANGSLAHASVRSLMRTAVHVPETKKIAELLREMQRDKFSLAIVVDEYGGTAGLVTMEDLLEEIVGEIRDEHDADEQEPISVHLGTRSRGRSGNEYRRRQCEARNRDSDRGFRDDRRLHGRAFRPASQRRRRDRRGRPHAPARRSNARPSHPRGSHLYQRQSSISRNNRRILTPPRAYKTRGIVLRRRQLSEADRIVTIFTRERGKLDAVAKGVRRMRSHLAGRLELANECDLLMHRGRTLDVIVSAETISAPWPTLVEPGPLRRRVAYGRNDRRILRTRPGASRSVRLAGRRRSGRSRLVRIPLGLLPRFSLRLLDMLGLAPPLDRCVQCGLRLRPVSVWLDAEAGGFVDEACRERWRDLAELTAEDLVNLRALAVPKRQRGRGTCTRRRRQRMRLPSWWRIISAVGPRPSPISVASEHDHGTGRRQQAHRHRGFRPERHLRASGCNHRPDEPARTILQESKTWPIPTAILELVVGDPLTLAGDRGIAAREMDAFVEKLREVFAGTIHRVDERLTTAQATKSLIAADVSRQKRRTMVDRMAAALILESFLARRRKRAERVRFLARSVAGVAASLVALAIVACALFWYVVAADRSHPQASQQLVIQRGATFGEVATQLGGRGSDRQHADVSEFLRDCATKMRRCAPGNTASGRASRRAKCLHALVTGGAQVATWVTIPEGFTAEQIAERLQGDGSGFLGSAATGLHAREVAGRRRSHEEPRGISLSKHLLDAAGSGAGADRGAADRRSFSRSCPRRRGAGARAARERPASRNRRIARRAGGEESNRTVRKSPP